jgi:CRP-like cAMP-binding protein
VKSGEVALMLPVSEESAASFRVLAGTLVGLPAVFSNEPYSMTAIAWKGSEVEEMSCENFNEMIASDPTLSLAVLRDSCG